jgi:hypothetical protein
LVAADVWIVGVALPVEPGVGTPMGEFGLAMPITGPGFGGPGGVIGLIAPPITGAGFGALPTALCCVLAPPIVLCASAGEMPAAATPSAQASIHPIIALLFMRASHVRAVRADVNVILSRAFAKACWRSKGLFEIKCSAAQWFPAFCVGGILRPGYFPAIIGRRPTTERRERHRLFNEIDTSGKSPA